MAKQSQPNPEMGARAKARREALGIKKNELAVTLDIGTGRITQMEQDGVDGLALARRWAEALQMDPQELVFGDPEKLKGLVYQDVPTATELSRLSEHKLAEVWIGRDAQKQVLSNVLRGRILPGDRVTRKAIVEKMSGRPLRDLAHVVAEVLK